MTLPLLMNLGFAAGDGGASSPAAQSPQPSRYWTRYTVSDYHLWVLVTALGLYL